MSAEDHCMRCQRPTPDDLPVDWEAISGPGPGLEIVGMICPGCMTAEEHQEIFEEDTEFFASYLEGRGTADDV